MSSLHRIRANYFTGSEVTDIPLLSEGNL